jgi:hypothetical protein
MNPHARIETIEVLVNPAERKGLTALCQMLGIPVSTYLRSLGNREVQRHGMPPAPPRESRACRGGRPASRASVGMRRQV